MYNNMQPWTLVRIRVLSPFLFKNDIQNCTFGKHDSSFLWVFIMFKTQNVLTEGSGFINITGMKIFVIQKSTIRFCKYFWKIKISFGIKMLSFQNHDRNSYHFSIHDRNSCHFSIETHHMLFLGYHWGEYWHMKHKGRRSRWNLPKYFKPIGRRGLAFLRRIRRFWCGYFHGIRLDCGVLGFSLSLWRHLCLAYPVEILLKSGRELFSPFIISILKSNTLKIACHRAKIWLKISYWNFWTYKTIAKTFFLTVE